MDIREVTISDDHGWQTLNPNPTGTGDDEYTDIEERIIDGV